MTDASPGDAGAEPEQAAFSPGEPTVWHRATTTAYVESPERVVVLDLDRLDLPPYVFEGSAARIWSHLGEGRSEAALVAALAQEYDAPADVVARDVGEFVVRLRSLGLVVGGAVAHPDR